MELAQLLDDAQSVDSLPLALSPKMVEQLACHWQMLCAWGERINLTAEKDPRRAVYSHYIDSLQAVPWLEPSSLVDVGSGAGFPGIPLAVVRADLNVTLLEPRRKRVSFLKAVIAKMGLENVTVLRGRVQDAGHGRFATLVTRATFSTEIDLRRCLGWVDRGGVMLAYRGVTAAPLPAAESQRYILPGVGERCLDVVRVEDHHA